MITPTSYASRSFSGAFHNMSDVRMTGLRNSSGPTDVVAASSYAN